MQKANIEHTLIEPGRFVIEPRRLVESSTITINIETLPKGAYNIQLQKQNGTYKNYSFIKN
jgi:hypothetical protein